MRIPLAATLLLTLTSGLFAADALPESSPAFTLTATHVAQLKPTTIIYQSLHIRMTDADTQRKTIADLMTKLFAAHVRINGGPIYLFSHPTGNATAEVDLDIAIPVPDKTPAPEGCQTRILEAAPSVTAIYQGPLASMGQAISRLFQQLPKLTQHPTGELRTRNLYYEDAASPNNIVLLEIPVTPAE